MSSRVIVGHFGDESLQSVTCTESLALVLTNQNNQQIEHVQNTNQCELTKWLNLG